MSAICMWWSTWRKLGKHWGLWWKAAFAEFCRRCATIFSLKPTSCCKSITFQTCLYYLRVRRHARHDRAPTTGADRVSPRRDFIKWKSRAAETTQKIRMQPGWQDLWVCMYKHTLLGKTIQQRNGAKSEESRVWKRCLCCRKKKINQQKNNQKCLDLMVGKWSKAVRMATARQSNSFYAMPLGCRALLGSWPF